MEGWGTKMVSTGLGPCQGEAPKIRAKERTGFSFFEKHNVVITSKSRALQDSVMYFMV